MIYFTNMGISPELAVSVIGLLVTNGAALAAVFTNLNIKIAENATDILSIKNDIEEHKAKNKDDLKELKDAILRDKVDNREDHSKIVADLALINKNIADLRVDIIKAIKGK